MLLLLSICAYLPLAAQDGVKFFEGSWEEALKLAKTEDKIIFVDAYTTWCGPCKMMSAQTFPVKEVGEFYNANFINMKLDMEKEGDGVTFRRKYNVNAFPTLLYIDGDGKVVQTVMGFKQAAPFIEAGKNALKSIDRTSEFEKKYEAGDRDPEMLRKYAYALLKSGKEYLKVANEYIRTQTDLKSETNLNFIYDFANEADSRIFSMLVENREAIAKLKTDEAIRTKFYSACNKTVKKAIEFKSEKLLADAKAMMKRIDKANAKKFAYKADMEYYMGTENTAAYIAAADQYAKKIIKTDAAALHDLARTVDHKVGDKTALAKAEQWAARAVKLAPKYDHYLTYANLLAKNGKKTEALDAVNKAIAAAASENLKPAAAEMLKQKLAN